MALEVVMVPEEVDLVLEEVDLVPEEVDLVLELDLALEVVIHLLYCLPHPLCLARLCY